MLFTGILIFAAYADYTTRKIPNTITAALILTSMLCSTASVIERAAGFIIPAAPLFFIALKNPDVKGGDIKYLSAVGAHTGLLELAKILVPVTITAVVWGYVHKSNSVPLAVVFLIGYLIYYAVIFVTGR